ncbi:MFS general substrate transporter [Phanerochaete sordida]|uniref:MFS general substrate transporter n=1 Tax=Phanerochaete sordida TaxID=48140 RepID=A0A9P3G5F7_9APHY|nr:MFS general substrate transporter [Phanerochaete sordida]
MSEDGPTANESVNEETPLLDDAVRKHEEVYNRFTPAQKRTITALISLAGLLPLFVSGTFIPSIPQIAKDLNTTGSVVNVAVSLSIFANAFGSLFWATYSGYYGRKPIYLTSIAFEAVGSFGVAISRSVPQLLVCRVVQAFGASSGLSVGVGVIGDIYKLEERGGASGIFFSAVLLGAALAPLVGGTTSHYYTWRAMQFGLSGFAVFCWFMTLFLQPETSQPGARGIDKARAAGEKRNWVWLNPLRSLGLLRSPNVLFLALEGAFVLLTDYGLVVPIAFTIGKRYGIHNEALLGALCIPLGVGNFVGAPLSGWLSDRIIVKWRKRRGGTWVPEDRLRAALSGAAIMVPCSVLFSGLVTQFVPGRLGLVLNLGALFVNGLGVDFVLTPSTAYIVDILHQRSAEATAASMCFRGILIALCVAFILPAIETFGVAATNGALAVMAWVGFGLVWSVVKYGDKFRAWVDVGFTDLKNN